MKLLNYARALLAQVALVTAVCLLPDDEELDPAVELIVEANEAVARAYQTEQRFGR